jgi:hypothetical protein
MDGAPPPPPPGGVAFKGIKLKRFNWAKIPVPKLPRTVFANIPDSGDVELDTKTLEEQFAVKTMKIAAQSKKKERVVQVLDLKRANTVGNDGLL